MNENGPVRVQLRRTKGWRKPDGVVVVSRPGMWGNPVKMGDVGFQYPSLDETGVHGMAVSLFRDIVTCGKHDLPNPAYISLRLPNWLTPDGTRHGYRGPVAFIYPGVEYIRATLAGRDLACWCPLDQPCHADVLLEIANGGAS